MQHSPAALNASRPRNDLVATLVNRPMHTNHRPLPGVSKEDARGQFVILRALRRRVAHPGRGCCQVDVNDLCSELCVTARTNQGLLRAKRLPDEDECSSELEATSRPIDEEMSSSFSVRGVAR